MQITQQYLDHLTYKITGCAIEVHKQLGAGLLECVYEQCFIRELALRGLSYNKQQKVQVTYKGYSFETELRLDVVIEDVIIVELKAVEEILPVHEAQLLTYMKLMEKPKGILFNFNSVNIFKDGRKTLVNQHYSFLPTS